MHLVFKCHTLQKSNHQKVFKNKSIQASMQSALSKTPTQGTCAYIMYLEGSLLMQSLFLGIKFGIFVNSDAFSWK